ncbi:MAG: sigma-70 family RNA polymerase sigma factor [Clostridia bacterium]|nr:sigma-70 family RNA polymerase sigma factor [Clostridia bacterium]
MENEEFTRAILGMTDTLYRVASAQLRQRADREDAVQECLRKAWEHRHRLRDERYLQTWVIRILLNECHTMQRRMARTLPQEDVPAVQHTREEGPLKEAMLRLEERYRMPLMLHYMEGYTVEETARILRVPQGTVKTWLSRGRKTLKAILNEEVFEG